MLEFIKNIFKKEEKTDEQIFAECRQRVKKYHEKLWKQNRRLLVYNALRHDVIMRQYIKDAYDDKNEQTTSLVNDTVRYIRREIVWCVECKECDEARNSAIDRLEWLKEIDGRFNLNYYDEKYEELYYALIKDFKKQEKESKKAEIISATSDYIV